jgi:ectoine hydroxylase-related dioxygenase (phytanoyl-CoA dioxygenase family)
MSDVLDKPAFRSQSPISRRMGRSDAPALDRTLAKIDELGLNKNLLELETRGYTVVEGVLSEERIERAKAAILRRVESKTGRKLDPHAATAADFHGMAYQHYLIFDDPVFQDILLEPRPLALVTYLLGESCVLSSMGCHFRGPGGLPLGVHADGSANGLMSSASMVANCNYALTPYTQEAGALVMFPGSHNRQRQPTPHENWTADGKTMLQVMDRSPTPNDLDVVDWACPQGGVTMNINPGDAVVWHGNTWHGGWRRDIPGVRMNLSAYFCRQHMLPQERRGDDRYPDVFERHSNEPRFAQLMSKNVYNGWREEGPDNSGARPTPAGLFD